MKTLSLLQWIATAKKLNPIISLLCSRIVYLFMRVMLLLLDLQTADILVLHFFGNSVDPVK